MKILRVPEVSDRIGYSIPSIWRLAREGKFPKPLKLGPQASGWLEDEVEAWINTRIDERDSA
jgi:prophage regulatory protein